MNLHFRPLTAVALVAALATVASAAPARPPTLVLSHEGRLLDAEDHPVTTAVELTITIYTAKTGNDSVFTDKWTVSPRDGIYQVQIGEPGDDASHQLLFASAFDGTQRWLGVKVGSSAELTPRLPLTSAVFSPYATKAGVASDVACNGCIDADELSFDPTPADGSVTAAKLAADAVESGKIKDGAVTSTKLANGAVEADHLAAGAVSHVHLAPDAVETDQLKDGAVTAAKLAANAVTADKLAANTVSAEKLADGAVTGAKLADGSVTASRLAADAVETAKIKNGAITGEKVADGSLPIAKLSDAGVFLRNDQAAVSQNLLYSPVRVLANDPAIIYTGGTTGTGWTRWDDANGWRAPGGWGVLTVADTAADNTVTLTFHGRKIELVYGNWTNAGIFECNVDTLPSVSIDTFGPANRHDQRALIADNLDVETARDHTVKCVQKAQKNGSSTAFRIHFEGFVVYPMAGKLSPVGPVRTGFVPAGAIKWSASKYTGAQVFDATAYGAAGEKICGVGYHVCATSEVELYQTLAPRLPGACPTTQCWVAGPWNGDSAQYIRGSRATRDAVWWQAGSQTANVCDASSYPATYWDARVATGREKHAVGCVAATSNFNAACCRDGTF